MLTVSQDSVWDVARRDRFYCPVCGQVRVRLDRPFLSPEIVGSVVMPHEFWTNPAAKEYCPGGTFDEEKDRAP